jgi:putative transposase
MIEPTHRALSLSRQCRLLGLARSSYYHEFQPESAENLALMKAIDKAHTDQPFFGARQLVLFLGDEGWVVNRKRVRRLMILMGLEAMCPKPDLSKPNRAHAVFPYLLKGLAITRPNQVWSTDITFVPIVGGFAYLCAVIDWYSRMVLAWTLSNTMDVGFCIETLQAALRQYGCPEIFNSDQGSQFTSPEFTQILLDREIRISMDGKGRCLDNVFVERLWRSVKYEEIYIFGYDSISIGQLRLAAYFEFYNHRRPHSSLDGLKPAEAYAATLPLAVNQ